ncbi:hypothetical protein ACFOHS_11795 [Jhaorihella thermophila]
MTEGHLKRRIGLGLLTAYGVGVMVGSGIYVLVGAIAGQAGVWAPVSFLIAGLIAAPAALSYAEFSTRLPEAAGEAAYVAQGAAQPGARAAGGVGHRRLGHDFGGRRAARRCGLSGGRLRRA